MPFTDKAKPVQSGFSSKAKPVTPKGTVNVGGVPLNVDGQDKSLLGQYVQLQKDTLTGAQKGVKSTAKGLGTLGYKLGTAVGLPSLPGQQIYQTGSPEEVALSQSLKPEGVAQNVGYFAEKALETMAPAGALGKVDNALGAIPNALGRITARTAVDAGAQGALGYIQSGGDVETAKTQAIIGGTIKGATSILGELAKKVNLPTRLYQGFLKDPVIAKEAKDRGLQGTLQGMTTQVKEVLPNIENKVVAIADASDTVIPVNKKLPAVFTAMAEDLSKLADDATALKAAELARKASEGNVDMKTALEMRRFLDSEIAYTKSGLAPKGDRVLKSFADELRTKINASDLGSVMKDYQFYIKTAEALRKEAIRSGNREVVGLFDTILFGSGLASAEPMTGLAVAGTQKAVRSVAGRTALAQLLEKLPETSTFGTAIKSLIGQVTGKSVENKK